MKKSAFYIIVFLGLLLSVLFQNCGSKKTPSNSVNINESGYEFIDENNQNYVYLHAYDDFGSSYDIDLGSGTISWDMVGSGAPTIPHQLTREELHDLQNLLDEAVYCRAQGSVAAPGYYYKYTFTFINDDVLENEQFDLTNTLCSYGVDSLEVSQIFGYMRALYNRYRNGSDNEPIPKIDDPAM